MYYYNRKGNKHKIDAILKSRQHIVISEHLENNFEAVIHHELRKTMMEIKD
jgi:hypothetical protein